MAHLTINIDMDRLCPECGKGGACDNGICLSCTANAIDPDYRMRSKAGKAVQRRFIESHRREQAKRGRWGSL